MDSFSPLLSLNQVMGVELKARWGPRGGLHSGLVASNGMQAVFWGGGGRGCHFRTKHITNTWFEHFHACCRFTCIPYISTFYSLGYENKPVALFKTPQMRTRREKDEIERVKMKEVTCITDSDVEDIPNIKK